MLNQQWQRQSGECKPTKTNIFKHSKTSNAEPLSLTRKLWRAAIFHADYQNEIKTKVAKDKLAPILLEKKNEISRRNHKPFRVWLFLKWKRQKKRKSNWRMKNVLNCRENEAFVLILWRRRDRISLPTLPLGNALCLVRDETVKKKRRRKNKYDCY